MGHPFDPARDAALWDLRIKVLSEASKFTFARYEARADPTRRPTGPEPNLDDLDVACLALADKLREPVTCLACGQEIPHDGGAAAGAAGVDRDRDGRSADDGGGRGPVPGVAGAGRPGDG